MKLTDQEQVILRAIDHVGRAGLAEIAKVVKAVGYPKATTKKILLRLSEKGTVSLHRHDWPASLTPEQRKLLVKLGSNYYSAVSVMKRNPSKQSKGKAAARRAGKALKGLARGALQSGAEILGAGAMALNPSQKRKRATKKKPNKTIIKAKRIDHLDVAKVHNPRRRNATTKKSSKAKRLAKLAVKGLTKKNPFSPMGFEYRKGHEFGSPRLRGQKAAKLRIRLNRLTERWEKAKTAAQLAKIKKEMDATWAQLHELGVTNPHKRRAKKNASTTISSKPSKTRRAGAFSKSGRKKAAGKVRSVAKARKVTTRGASSNPRRGSRKKLGAAKRAVSAGKFTYADWSTPLLRAQRKDTASHLKWLGDKEPRAAAIVRARLEEIDKELARRGSKKGKRNNPSAESIRKTFAGQINGERDLFFPQGTPSGKLAKLGRLVSITTEEGTIKPVHGTAWLCADTKERLHIGSTTNAPLYSGPARSFGKVTKVEYESSKPHLGYRGPIIWFHHMGEKGGTKPTLHADGKGGLKFKGGNYTLTTRGIEH